MDQLGLYNRWTSLLVTPSRIAASTSARLIQSSSVFGMQPILDIIDFTTIHPEGDHATSCSKGYKK